MQITSLIRPAVSTEQPEACNKHRQRHWTITGTFMPLTRLCSASYVRWQRGTAHMRPPRAALLCAVQQSIDTSCRPDPQQQTCSSGVRMGQTDSRTDGRTPDRCIDPAPPRTRSVPTEVDILHYCNIHVTTE